VADKPNEQAGRDDPGREGADRSSQSTPLLSTSAAFRPAAWFAFGREVAEAYVVYMERQT
jgi:hypothetical protein